MNFPPLPTNASSSTCKKRASSSNDTRVVHPYVVQERQKMILLGDKTRWQTSKIVRSKNGDISIKIFEK